MRQSKFFLPIIVIAVVGIFFSVFTQTKTETVKKCKVVNLQQQNLIQSNDKGEMSTEIRYLVITDKETFVCESSLMNGKFNNSDIFFRLQKDSVYDFKVAGMGKSFVTDYRNILEVVK